MQRQKVKGTGHKQPTDVSTEPNFYAMPKLEGESEGKTVAMEEVAVSVGAGDSMPSLFLLSQSNSNPPPPCAPPDGQLNAQYPLSYLNSPGIQAATMLRRLSASNVNAPPFSIGDSAMAGGSAYQDTNTASTTTFQPTTILESCALANAAGNDESEHGSFASKTHSTKEGTKMEYV